MQNHKHAIATTLIYIKESAYCFYEIGTGCALTFVEGPAQSRLVVGGRGLAEAGGGRGHSATADGRRRTEALEGGAGRADWDWEARWRLGGWRAVG
jgi:hypothetical protein